MAASRVLTVSILGDAAGARNAFAQTAAAAGQLNATVEDSGGGFSKLAGFAANTGVAIGAALALAGGAALKSGIGFNAFSEQAQIGFTTMLGSGEKAQAFLADLQKFAAATPFELPGLTQNAQRLLAMGFSAEKVIPMLTAVGDAAAGLGTGEEGVSRVTTALGQMQAKGKVSAEEMNQLTEANIPAWRYLAAAIGTDIPTAMDRASKGLIPAGVAIDGILAGMTKDFGGMMAGQSRTFNGLRSSLNDLQAQLLGVATKPIFDRLTKGLGALVDMLSSPKGMAAATAFAARLESGLQRAEAAIPRVVAGFRTLTGTIEQVRQIIANRDFVGGGALGEDGPLTRGLFAIRDGATALTGTFEQLRQTASRLGTAILQGFYAGDTEVPFAGLLAGALRLNELATGTLIPTAGRLKTALADGFYAGDEGVPFAGLLGGVLGLNSALTGTLFPTLSRLKTAILEGFYGGDESVPFASLLDAALGLNAALGPASDRLADFRDRLAEIADNPLVKQIMQWSAIFLASAVAVNATVVAFTGIFGLLTKAGPLFGAIGSLVTAVVGGFTILGSVLGVLLSPLGLVVAAVGLLALAWYKNWAGMRDATTAAIPAIQGFFTGTLLPLLSQFGTWVQSVGPVVQAFFVGTLIPAFQAVASFVMGTLWPAMQTAWTGITGAIGTAVATISPYLQTFRDVFTYLTGGEVAGGLAAFGPIFQGFADNLGTMLGDLVGKLLAWGLEMGTRFIEWIGPMIPPFLEALGGFLSRALEFLTTVALPAFVTMMGSFASAFWGWVEPMIPPLLEKLGGLMISLQAWFDETAKPAIVAKLAEWGTAFGDWVLTTAVPYLLEKLAALLTALGDWVLNTALPQIPGLLAGFGEAIVGGIQAGIEGAWQGMVDWFAGKLKELPGPLKSVLGIASPSAVFASEVGAPIATGIIAGIQGQAGALNQAVAGLVDVPGVPAIGAGAAAGAAAAGAGAGGQTIVVYIQPGANIYGPEFLDILGAKVAEVATT